MSDLRNDLINEIDKLFNRNWNYLNESIKRLISRIYLDLEKQIDKYNNLKEEYGFLEIEKNQKINALKNENDKLKIELFNYEADKIAFESEKAKLEADKIAFESEKAKLEADKIAFESKEKTLIETMKDVFKKNIDKAVDKTFEGVMQIKNKKRKKDISSIIHLYNNEYETDSEDEDSDVEI